MRAVLLVVSILIPVLLLEAALRVRASQERSRSGWVKGSKELCVRRSTVSGLIYDYEPNACGYNSRGFRDDEHAVQKAPQTKRIVIIGDSVAEGIKVQRPSIFSDLLETRLNEQSGSDGRYETILIARRGYNTVQELILLEREVFQYEPDIILWIYCLNDPADAVYVPEASAGLSTFHYRPWSHVMHLVGQTIYRSRTDRDFPNPEQDPITDGWINGIHELERAAVEDNLSRIAAAVKGKAPNARVLFAVHPVFPPGRTWASYFALNTHKRLVEAAGEQGMISLDLVDIYRQDDPDALMIKDDPWHPNEAGHELLAACLSDFLLALFGPNQNDRPRDLWNASLTSCRGQAKVRLN